MADGTRRSESTQHHGQPHSLIVCASLVENPMNLGALCRTVEVFGLETLVLSRLDIAHRQEFRKLAVSAHQWQPLQSCAVEHLPAWLTARAQAGYVPLALTAHPRARPLPTFEFPQQAVLVLGRELTGIPEGILEQCQDAIAIPQFGRVESLNVQTAAAIAIYEYIRQQAS